MFKSLFNKSSGLKIRIMDSSHEFPDLDSFEHFIAVKTEVPATKMPGLMKLSDDELNDEIQHISLVETKINSKLAESINNPGMIDQYLGEATLTRFTQDHDWRSIIFELSSKDTEFTEYKTAAVSHYLQYLRSRRALMERIVHERNNQIDPMETAVINLDDHDRDSSVTVFARTAVIDLSKDEQAPALEKLTRLQKGVSVEINAGGLKEIPIRLAGRRFMLRFGNPMVFIDTNNREHAMIEGENMVGRDLNCHVRLDSAFPDISRRHVIIESLGDARLKITDLSSQGTFLPANFF